MSSYGIADRVSIDNFFGNQFVNYVEYFFHDHSEFTKPLADIKPREIY